jgi:mannitol-1-/sugar-/sorbitol-6-phosphatase
VVNAYPEALLLDVDGTLVDSREAVERTWRQVADEFGVPAGPILAGCHGRRDDDVVPEFFAPDRVAAVVARITDLETAYLDLVRPVPGAASLLAGWEPDRWAAVTSGPRTLMAGRLRAAGLPVPPVLVCAEDVTRGKPDPEGFLLAADALGVSPAGCVVVEDSPAGVAAGKASGAYVVAITTTHRASELAEADAVIAGWAGFSAAVGRAGRPSAASGGRRRPPDLPGRR